MRELIIFLFLFLAVFGTLLIVFNGRFIYAQIKYAVLGAPEKSPNNPFGAEKENNNLFIPQRLIVPVLGIDVPVILAENTEESVLQAALERGVVYWPDSALLGEGGTIIILGHSSAYPWYKGDYGSVFSTLNELKEDDEVFVFSAQNKYTYNVIGREIDFPENLVFEKQEEKSMLYLLSCWPIKTNWKRIAIKAISIDKN